MLNKEIKELKKKIDEMEWLKKKVHELETALDDIKHPKSQDLFKCKKCTVKCKLCTKDFSKDNYLEVHMKTEHKEVENFKCEICDKTFVLEWRLKKHRNIHTEKAANLKFCHYYNI